MRILENGEYRDATAEEIALIEAEETAGGESALPTQEERLQALESAMLDLIIGG